MRQCAQIFNEHKKNLFAISYIWYTSSQTIIDVSILFHTVSSQLNIRNIIYKKHRIADWLANSIVIQQLKKTTEC